MCASAVRLALAGSLVLAARVPQPLSAQAATTRTLISGTVIDQLGNPIEGAEVRMVGDSLRVMTSPVGFFRLSIPFRKKLLLQIRRPGYGSQLLDIVGDWSGKILLTPGPVQLPEVEVTARYGKPARYAGTNKYDEVFQRQRLGLGQLITREEIDRRAAQETTQLLEARAGIRVQISRAEMAGDIGGTFVTFSRCNEFPPKINVYVDGHKLTPRWTASGMEDGASILTLMASQPTQKELDRRREIRMQIGEMLDRINPSDIELIEIFRGASELPAEFNDGNCGAIAVWTRLGGH